MIILKTEEQKQEIMKKAADRLIRLRIAKGYLRKEVTKETGVNASTLSQVEKGKYLPSIKSMRRLANFYGVEMYKIWEHLPSPKDVENILNQGI